MIVYIGCAVSKGRFVKGMRRRASDLELNGLIMNYLNSQSFNYWLVQRQTLVTPSSGLPHPPRIASDKPFTKARKPVLYPDTENSA
jgi:hypothetical protein